MVELPLSQEGVFLMTTDFRLRTAAHYCQTLQQTSQSSEFGSSYLLVPLNCLHSSDRLVHLALALHDLLLGHPQLLLEGLRFVANLCHPLHSAALRAVL